MATGRARQWLNGASGLASRISHRTQDNGGTIDRGRVLLSPGVRGATTSRCTSGEAPAAVPRHVAARFVRADQSRARRGPGLPG